MSRFDFSEKLNFNEIDLTPPEKVIREANKELSRETKGIIGMGVEAYEGDIAQQKPSYAGLFANSSGTFSVLPDMGKLGEERYQYEVYLYTPSYKSYKFRMMFLRYGMASYPAEVILEQGVADAASGDKRYADIVMRVENREQMEKLIDNILNTDYILAVMQELIRVDQMQRYRRSNHLGTMPPVTGKNSNKK